ncbi:sulfurtransferase TusA family protein [Candidatus Nanohalococcus occultus]|uniref:TusA-related sulfurtransferase n=1 Tax=Candidatus Nanohalococcus occultus TaxID=2978047 RepID=A0ABY8CEH6_9ARCH|nr:TusA-related sulfurtransferase [Candidatus Nanohaloarchaeota archaeon SVXNc]
MSYDITKTVDVKGKSCPMPIVKTRQAINDLESGQVLETLSTDSGSENDFQGWVGGSSDVKLLEMKTEDGVYKFYIEKK